MIWIWLFAVFVTILFGVMIGLFIRDRRYEHKKTSEAFSEALRQEIEEEREEALIRKKRFEEELKRAKDSSKITLTPP